MIVLSVQLLANPSLRIRQGTYRLTTRLVLITLPTIGVKNLCLIIQQCHPRSLISPCVKFIFQAMLFSHTGLDRNSLRDLVEEDSSNWTRAELDEFVETAQASLESLYTDIDQISAIHHRIQRTGLICRDDVQQLEVIHPGLITSQDSDWTFHFFRVCELCSSIS